jgi:hypothetical protein
MLTPCVDEQLCRRATKYAGANPRPPKGLRAPRAARIDDERFASGTLASCLSDTRRHASLEAWSDDGGGRASVA